MGGGGGSGVGAADEASPAFASVLRLLHSSSIFLASARRSSGDMRMAWSLRLASSSSADARMREARTRVRAPARGSGREGSAARESASEPMIAISTARATCIV